MRYLIIVIVALLLLVATTTKAQFPDPSDPALDEPPPPGGYKLCPKPVLIEDPCEIYIAGVKQGKPIITIAASMKKPVPVTYTTVTDDTAMYITLQVIRTNHMPRFQSRIQLPGDSFHVYVGYEDAPGEQGEFVITKVGEEWTIRAVKETGFIRLGRSPEVAVKQRKE